MASHPKVVVHQVIGQLVRLDIQTKKLDRCTIHESEDIPLKAHQKNTAQNERYVSAISIIINPFTNNRTVGTGVWMMGGGGARAVLVPWTHAMEIIPPEPNAF